MPSSTRLPEARRACARDVMELANPRKKGAPDYVYASGTLNGNPLSASAGLATLEVMQQPGTYDKLNAIGESLRAGLREIASRLGIPAQVLGRGPLANIYFTGEPVVDYRSGLKSDSRITQQLGRALLTCGVLTNLAAKMYLSLDHGEAEIQRTLQAFEDVLRDICSKPGATGLA